MSPETLLETETVRVRIMPLAPREIAPLHFHTQMFEHIVCLNGAISVFIQQGEETNLLPGQCITIQPTVPHQIKNSSDTVSKYLLTQSGGAYDFCDASA